MEPIASTQSAHPKANLKLQDAPAADKADENRTPHGESAQAAPSHAAQTKLSVELDKDSGRFVQVVTDAQTDETLRRYPNEAQLAYSRAVMAYVRAQFGR